MTYFREVQYIRRPWLFALFLGIAAFGAYWAIRHHQQGEPLGLMFDIGIWANVAITSGLALWLWFVRLETEVRERDVVLRYRLMWTPKEIAFDEIEKVEEFDYRPVRDYGGWGLRYGGRERKEWLWNAYGNRAVRFHLTNGRTFSVGSQMPEKLASAVNERRGASR